MRARANTMYIFHLSCCSDPLNFTSDYEPMCILFSSNAYYLISHVSTNTYMLALPIQKYELLRKIIVSLFDYTFLFERRYKQFHKCTAFILQPQY